VPQLCVPQLWVPETEISTVAVYMQCKGKISGLIKGSVTTAGFQDWIDVAGLQWGFTGSKQGGGDPTVNEVVITKRADVASPLLIQSGLSNETLTGVVFKFTTTIKDGVSTFTSYELTNARITKYGVTAEADGRTVETFNLGFQKFQQTFIPLDSKLASGSPTSVSYELQSGKTTS
jgi:type VI secretion system Hcp family effector